ncbi:hypothetical protein DT376_45825, partial [Pseudomonas aeruginosa]
NNWAIGVFLMEPWLSMVSVRCWQATPRIAVVSLEVEERRPGLFPWRAVGNQSRRSRQSAVPAGRCADSQPQAA